MISSWLFTSAALGILQYSGANTAPIPYLISSSCLQFQRMPMPSTSFLVFPCRYDSSQVIEQSIRCKRRLLVASRKDFTFLKSLTFPPSCTLNVVDVISGAEADTLWPWGKSQENHRDAYPDNALPSASTRRCLSPNSLSYEIIKSLYSLNHCQIFCCLQQTRSIWLPGSL